MTADNESPTAQEQDKSSPAAIDRSSAQSQQGEDSSQGITSTHADPFDALENRNTTFSIASSMNPSLYSEADPKDATAMTVQQARPTRGSMESYHTAQEQPTTDPPSQQSKRIEENRNSHTAKPELRAAIQDALGGIPARTSSMQYHDETVGPGGYIDPSQPQPPTLLGQQAPSASSQTRPTQLPGGGPWAAPPSPAQTTNTANAEQQDSNEEDDSPDDEQKNSEASDKQLDTS